MPGGGASLGFPLLGRPAVRFQYRTDKCKNKCWLQECYLSNGGAADEGGPVKWSSGSDVILAEPPERKAR